MLYTFMNKNYKLFDFEYDFKINAIINITNIYDKSRLPLFLANSNNEYLISNFNSWLSQRYSKNSSWFKKQQWNYNFLKLTNDLVIKSYGLSLSDQYWIKPKSDDKTWEEINFFTNDFVFKSFITNLSREYNYGSVDVLYSPDITTGGEVDKAWIIENDVRILCKSSNTFLGIEPINEWIASKIAEIINLPHVIYDIKLLSNLEKKTMVSTCPTFINENTELIPAFQIIKKDDSVEYEYEKYIETLNNHGINNAKEKIDKMILLDLIMSNCDRHMNNYGVIRDINTLKWLDVSPIYDTGRSLATSYPSVQDYDDTIILFTHACKRKDAFKFIKDIELSVEQISKLKEIPIQYKEMLLKYKKYTNIKEDNNKRVEEIVALLSKNINEVLNLNSK